MTRIRALLGDVKRAAKRRFLRRGLILIYHRVASDQIDPWRLCISEQNFASHLEVLHGLDCKLMHVSTLAARLVEGQLDRRTVAITFDDGYYDNLLSGRPVLERYSAPATLFASAGYIGLDEEFWWDELERIFLEPGSLPDVLELTIGGRQHRWELGAAAHFSPADAARWPEWKALRDPPSMRHRLHDDLWRTLFRSLPSERAKILSLLREWASVQPGARPDRRPLTEAELRQLHGDGLVEIGSHGVSHTALATLSSDLQGAELIDSKRRLEQLLERPVIGCSYPQGGTSPGTETEVRKAGYAFACSSTPRSVRLGAELYQLPRVSVGNWEASKFKSFVEGHLAS